MSNETMTDARALATAAQHMDFSDQKARNAWDHLAARLRGEAAQKDCSEERPCIPCFTGNGSCDAAAKGEQQAVAWCVLTDAGQIAYFDGKPMVMVGPSTNQIHTTPLYTRAQPAAPDGGVLTALQECRDKRQATPAPVACQACGLPPIEAGLPPLKTCQCARLVMRPKPAPVAGDAVRESLETLATELRRLAVGPPSAEKGALADLADIAKGAAAALAQDRASQAGAAGVPEGWSLVPVEPTGRMIDAGILAYDGKCESSYAAMLAAAPTQTPKG